MSNEQFVTGWKEYNQIYDRFKGAIHRFVTGLKVQYAIL